MLCLHLLHSVFGDLILNFSQIAVPSHFHLSLHINTVHLCELVLETGGISFLLSPPFLKTSSYVQI